jgi:hypothetical protein
MVTIRKLVDRRRVCYLSPQVLRKWAEKEFLNLPLRALDPFRVNMRTPPPGMERHVSDTHCKCVLRESNRQKLEHIRNRRLASKTPADASFLMGDDEESTEAEAKNSLLLAYTLEYKQWETKRNRKRQADEEFGAVENFLEVRQLRIVIETLGISGGRTAPAAVSRRPPVPRYRIVARTEG